MSKRFVSVDRHTPMLLPPDLRDWVPADDPVHFILAFVEQTPTEAFHINARGSGSAQYPPPMMLALLVYCYSMGIFSSRKIERATHRDVAVRYLTGDTHPDHDTICTFRRNNKAAIEACFVRAIVHAKEMGLTNVGVVSVDGTLMKANASKSRTITYAHAQALEQRLAETIRSLMDQAESADRDETDDRLPEALADHERLHKAVREAKERIEARAREHKEKMDKTPVKDRRGANKKRHPKGRPDKNDRDNLTDPDSRIMRKSAGAGWTQGYNAQAVVDAGGSQLILGTRISQSSNDGCELVADIDAIPNEAGTPTTVLSDSGYASQTEINTLEARGMDLYVSIQAEPPMPNPLTLHSDTPTQTNTPKRNNPNAKTPLGKRMREKLATPEGRALYRKRKHTVEPVFGIIKHVLGFTQFNLRGKDNVALEWQLIALAYNMKRLYKLHHNPATA
jgi:transposase